MNKAIFPIVICLAVNVYSQTSSRAGSYRIYDVVLLPQGYGIKLLNFEGTPSIVNDVSNISAMNPASISQIENYSFGVSYQFQTDIDEAWFAGIGTSRIYNYLPQSLGGVIKYENFSFGLGFWQKYNGSIDLGPIPVTTSEHPDGTGEFITFEMERSILSFSLVAAYDFIDLISENSTLSVGLKYNPNRFHNYEHFSSVRAEGTIIGSSWEIGTTYKLEYDKGKNILAGISYCSALEMGGKINYSSNTNLTIIPGSSRPGSYYVITPPLTRVRTPDELHFDFGIKPTVDFTLLASIAGIFWKTSNEGTKNQIEFSSSAVYSFSPSTAGSFGFYYTDYGYTTNYFDISGNMYALFLTTGVSFNIDMFNVGFTIADSHLHSGDYRKQTIGKISLGIHL